MDELNYMGSKNNGYEQFTKNSNFYQGWSYRQVKNQNLYRPLTCKIKSLDKRRDYLLCKKHWCNISPKVISPWSLWKPNFLPYTLFCHKELLAHFLLKLKLIQKSIMTRSKKVEEDMKQKEESTRTATKEVLTEETSMLDKEVEEREILTSPQISIIFPQRV